MAELLGELLERCRRGDREAIGVLVRRFEAWARDLAGGLLGDAYLAEDAVQWAFVRALSRLEDLRDPAAFPGWLRQIVRTECHRIARREKTQREAISDTQVMRDGAPAPLERVELEERARLVREALQALPPAGREAAELFYLKQCDCAQVAERLRVPVGTVKRRLHDARARLRQLLLSCAPEPVQVMKGQDARQVSRRMPL